MSTQPDSTSEKDSKSNLHWFGLLVIPLAIFPFLALCTYDWHNVSDLAIPVATPNTNLIGIVGVWFAYVGYQLIGLAVWFLPVLCLFAAIRFFLGCSFQPGRRSFAATLFMFTATCLLQLTGHLPPVARLLHSLNIAPNAGGAVGYLVMTRGLARLLSPFGSGILMLVLMIYAIIHAIGFHTIVTWLSRLTAWAADRDTRADSTDELTETELGQAVANAQTARELAKAEREAEKQRKAEEKQRIAEEKAAAKAAREAEREAKRQELIRQREELARKKEEEQREREERLARLREQQQADLGLQLSGNGSLDDEDCMPAREDIAIGGAPAPTLSVRTPPSLPSTPPTPAARPAVVPAPKAPVAAQPAAASVPATATSAISQEPLEDKGPYLLPPVTLLHEVSPRSADSGEDPRVMAQRLIDTLKVYDVNAQLAYYVAGPVVTQYALALDLGTRVGRLTSLERDIQMALQATSLRIEAPIPGKNAVGIEVPNSKPVSIAFREIIDGELWQKNANGKFQLPMLLGKDAAGNDLVADLAKLPHLLVAGATGQGKSVCLNSIINGLLMCRTPEQLKFIMIDPKRVEFTSYQRLPHLLAPVINDTNKVVFALRSALVEMDKRLKMFSRAGVRNIVDFNTRKTVTQPDLLGGTDQVLGDDADMPRTIPYIVIVIDEVADIMAAAKKEVEPTIARLTALARATGIHLILATQRPSTDVITGVVKGNIPGRIAFKTSSSIDSRTILDATGSEQLIGKGDMLFKMADGRLLRAQGAYISDEEINNIISFIEEHSNVQFDEKLTKRLEKIKEADPSAELDGDDEDGENATPSPDDLPPESANGNPPPAGMTKGKEAAIYRQALIVLRDTKRASVSHFQRKMGIGYNHAARIVDLLEERGIIGPSKGGAGPREILLDPETILAQMDGASAPSAEPAPADASAMGTDPATAPAPEDDPFGFPPEST